MVKKDQPETIDLKQYQTLGVPIIKLMAGVALFSLLATAIYEYTII